MHLNKKTNRQKIVDQVYWNFFSNEFKYDAYLELCFFCSIYNSTKLGLVNSWE